MRTLLAAMVVLGAAACGMPGRPALALVEYEVENPTSCDAQVIYSTPGNESRLIAVVASGARLVVHAPETGTVGAAAPCDGNMHAPRVRRRGPAPDAERAGRR